MPFPVKSHSILFETLLKRLAEKGHEVDYVTHFLSEKTPERYNELSIRGSLPLFHNNFSVKALKDHSVYETIKFVTTSGGVDANSAIMKTAVLQSLKNTTKQYDLIITHLFGSDAMLGFGHLFNAPIVSITTCAVLPWAHGRIANPDNPSYVPNFYTSFLPKMNLYERIENTILWIMTRIWYNYLTMAPSNRLVKDFFGPDTPSLENLIQNTSLVLVNSHFSMQQVRPTVPNFIEVGGLHIREPQPLPKDLENLVSNNTFGVVYLSMGSMVITETFEPEILQAMFDAFAELPYTVLWKASPEKFPKGLTIPENIHFKTWMPQIDILCHPNVKLFISHGGLLGSQEAVYCAVPRIGIPLYGDQEANIHKSEKLGIAIKLAYGSITKDSFLETVKRVLEDLSYRHNVQKISQIFKDRPMSPLDTAVYWVEYVIKYKGAPHLRSVGADLPWYQYYLIDVAVILLFGLFVKFQDLENLVSNNTFGVVYLSMGSMVRTESFKPEILQAMFDAFAELPYTVLWKASPEKFPKGLKIPENIHFKTWMPQIDILCHPNVKLFISHGGLLGSQEAVYCAIPRIGIPFFDDQELNIVTYNELSLYGTLPDHVNNLSIEGMQNQTIYQRIKFMTRTAGVEAFSRILQTPVLRNLRNTTKKYHLIIVHQFGCDVMLGFGFLFNAPVISYVTSVSPPWIDDRIGNPDNPSYIQSHFSRSSAKMSLYERVENTIFWISARFWYSFFSGRSDQLVKDFFGHKTPSLENLIRNDSLVLVNSHFSLQQVRPLVPNFIEVGGLHIREPQPLPKDLENLVSNNKFGVIYLSMGSMIMTETYDPEILQAMFDAFAELPYTVLWKASPEKFPKGLKIPENIHFKMWMPQIDILCHPNVKLFISHGGMLGSQEAVYCAVPRIGVPIYADQERNIVTSEKLGIAKKLSYDHINKNTFLHTIKELIEDLKYVWLKKKLLLSNFC
ncbi:hypothetical protein TcasGA2_TC032756 [Tribolium castaneum]|uniref:Uncharacterized protein n=1 Tax=Tribolium castaneum TaxID=7070 RepID=A0A139WIV3_TRICA|nr:hypothetical protein TcasGA2_TC032756 [Tribolium castaneum]